MPIPGGGRGRTRSEIKPRKEQEGPDQFLPATGTQKTVVGARKVIFVPVIKTKTSESCLSASVGRKRHTGSLWAEIETENRDQENEGTAPVANAGHGGRVRIWSDQAIQAKKLICRGTPGPHGRDALNEESTSHMA